MTGIFKANNPNNNFLLFLYGLALKLPLFLYPQLPRLQSSDGILYKSFAGWMIRSVGNMPVFFSVISFILLFLQAVSFNKLVNDHRMLQKPNYLTGMSYLLVTSLFSEWFALSAALMANTILIWVWSRLSTLHNNNSAKSTIYNIGLVIGLAAFFYQPAIVFTLLFIVGMAITRPFRLNEWFIGLIGILTSFYFYAAWLFLTDRWKTYKIPNIDFSLPAFHETKWALSALIMVLLCMLLGVFFIRANMRRQVVQTRKSWQLIYLYLLVAAFVPFLNSTSFNSWILVAVPASLIMGAAFFYPDKKWFPALMQWGMVALSIAIGYFIR
ncbi:MAG: hypothetical protein EOO13_01485 [Chitinophagaceae bacterium]|nr:MAG: hypothetical protein EOO13_01485 [Chitinophagaceae bacterium]